DGTCTSTMRTADTCDACTSDAECLAGRRCVDHVFGGTSVGTFCFLDSADGGCGDTDAARRPYSTVVTLMSVDGWMTDYCMPPTTTTCQGIADARNVACSLDTDCGVVDVADGYCPTAGSGTGLCSYQCGGGVDCASVLNCGGGPQHCRP
ncbi:MAG: hypothetical protein DRJ42_09880, partial [Deltaproteobacteria bacterium]